ncbi:MAG TPA: hypothetical protein VJO53_12780 [Candidatus Acidoferrales bacterium]|nr:hypothetical protein [Candidatus Acidoferrales bacterium]
MIKNMTIHRKLPLARVQIYVLAIALAACLGFSGISLGQGTNPNKVTDKEQQQDQDQQLKQRDLDQTAAPAAPKVDPEEEAAYKTFYETNSQDADSRLRLGQDFLQKYPSSRYAESVHVGLVQAYYSKQDWKDFFAEADKALALQPDDVNVLTMVGWVIPHVSTADAADAALKLDLAETDEKRALEILATLPKPDNQTDEQFAAMKADKVSEAHSGLGLIYFRRQKYEDSVKELQLATQGASTPDPTDLFVLGFGLQKLNRNAEAADAFNRCSQIPSSLQDRCKQGADSARKQAASSK